ncbi:MAG: FbpB family small basic protein [Bacillales bacterium]|nr:FbpB family small basic protein [Bacillales bacterium]
MRKIRKRSFHDLVRENRQALLQDQQALDKIEERLEARLEMRRMEKAE